MESICTASLKFKFYNLKKRGNNLDINIAALTGVWMYDLMIEFRDYLNSLTLSDEKLKRDETAIRYKKEVFKNDSWDETKEILFNHDLLKDTAVIKARSLAASFHRWSGKSENNDFDIPRMDEPFKHIRRLIKYFRIAPRELFSAPFELTDRDLAEAIAYNLLLTPRKYAYTHKEVEEFIEDMVNYESLWVEDEKFSTYYKVPRRD